MNGQNTSHSKSLEKRSNRVAKILKLSIVEDINHVLIYIYIYSLLTSSFTTKTYINIGEII